MLKEKYILVYSSKKLMTGCWGQTDHGRPGPADHGTHRCTSEMRKRAEGKWMIIQWNTLDPMGDVTACGESKNPECKVYAICTKGCANFTVDHYSAEIERTEKLPFWPNSKFFSMRSTEWQLFRNGTGATARTVTATVGCCKRKAQECDSCSCPSFLGVCLHLTKWQQDCCLQHHAQEPLPFPSCDCRGVSDVCDHYHPNSSDARALVI